MRKFTMILMVVLAATSVVAGCDQSAVAEPEARQYIQRMYPNQQFTVSCMNYDTDSNGYVSCDAIVGGRPVALECAANAQCFMFCNSGCKLRSMLPIQQSSSSDSN